MAVSYNAPMRVYYQKSTNNKSFLDIYHYLEDKGIKNNKFFLALLDPALAGVNPFDPKLNMFMKQKILYECMRNEWYFLREVVRIPDSGVSTGVPFRLDRGNLAATFCQQLCMNIFQEQPRQTGKTISELCHYTWLFNFGTANSEMSFLNKKLDDSKLNLQRVREIRALLPSYLRMDQAFALDGSKIKAKSNVETLQHPVNGNRIRTVASARNKVAAASLMRGRTTPLLYIDEYAFILYNDIIYQNTIPAFMTAANNAKRNGKPYGIVVTTTPGMLTTDEGLEAFTLKEQATNFSELWYDLSISQINDILLSNTKSNFVYIKYNYQQLGKSEEWFRDICKEMRMDGPSIRREILLEWSQSNDNSPFRKEDLDTIKNLLRSPISSLLLLNKYTFDIYEKLNPRYPPLIGVDVSGGYQRDSSAITVVDSYSTRVAACMNSNFISTPELARVIYDIVTKYMPNAVVNVERNGGYGASVLAKLINTSIKKNLFYTIKDKIIEEHVMGSQIHKKTQKMKIYGSDSSKSERDTLMEILRNRVEYHKDKVISYQLYEELCGMEVKKSGKIEHSTNTHDDQVFSWLWALYIYYEGGDLMNQWGIMKREIKTDANIDEAAVDIDDAEKEGIAEQIDVQDDEDVQQQLDDLQNAPGKIMYEDWMKAEHEKDETAMQKILQTKPGREAFARQFHANITDVNAQCSRYTIPSSVFDDFYKDEYDDQNTGVDVGIGYDPNNPGFFDKFVK